MMIEEVVQVVKRKKLVVEYTKSQQCGFERKVYENIQFVSFIHMKKIEDGWRSTRKQEVVLERSVKG